MKRQILLMAAIFLSTLAMAQQKPSFGIKAGLSSARLEGDAVNSLKDLLEFSDGMITTGNHTGVFAGGYASIPLGTTMSVEPGLYYAQKGYELRGDLNIKGAEFIAANAKARLDAHYIDLPVVLKANISGLQIFAGPQLSYLAKADLKTTAGVFGFNLLNRTMDATDEMNRWDAGFTGGLGYQFKNGVNISAAYDHGLTKTDADQNMDAYNRSFKIGVGYSF